MSTTLPGPVLFRLLLVLVLALVLPWELDVDELLVLFVELWEVLFGVLAGLLVCVWLDLEVLDPEEVWSL